MKNIINKLTKDSIMVKTLSIINLVFLTKVIYSQYIDNTRPIMVYVLWAMFFYAISLIMFIFNFANKTSEVPKKPYNQKIIIGISVFATLLVVLGFINKLF